MKRITSTLLIFALWLGACTSSPAPAPVESTEAPAGVESTAVGAPTAPAESEAKENSEQTAAGREAVLSEFENEVTVRVSSDGEFGPAESGFVIQQGGALQTGENGRARLDLMPEGTIVRVSPNSAFTLPQLTETEGEPKTTLGLFFGKIFILLNGGSLDVQTPSGVASVRGSLLSVSYDPSTERLQAACLEGHCELENEEGEKIDLQEGESGYVDESGELNELDGIDQGEVWEWVEEVPELGEFLETPPDPETYPEFAEYQEYQFDPYQYYDQQPTDDGSWYWEFDESILPSESDYFEGGLTEPAPSEESTIDPNSGEPIPSEAPTQEEVPTEIPTEEPTPDPTGGGGEGNP